MACWTANGDLVLIGLPEFRETPILRRREFRKLMNPARAETDDDGRPDPKRILIWNAAGSALVFAVDGARIGWKMIEQSECEITDVRLPRDPGWPRGQLAVVGGGSFYSDDHTLVLSTTLFPAAIDLQQAEAHPLWIPEGGVATTWLSFAPGRERIVALLEGIKGQHLCTYDPSTWKLLRSRPVSCQYMAVLDEPSQIVLGIQDPGVIEFCDLASAEETQKLAWKTGVSAVAPGPGGVWLAIGTPGARVTLVCSKSHSTVYSLEYRAILERVQVSVDGGVLLVQTDRETRVHLRTPR
ncbi:MAG: hypothetical protein HYY18_12665 [Planctomycetes bacterium]|nr:hypothetical protein [Planctomycetota bacterium]